MVRSASSGFSDLIITGEGIENCLKIEKIHDKATVASASKKSHSEFPKKKEVETNAATTAKEEAEAYQIPYYKVEAVASLPYQQPTYAISTGPPPMQYQQPYAPQQPYALQQQN